MVMIEKQMTRFFSTYQFSFKGEESSSFAAHKLNIPPPVCVNAKWWKFE